MNLPVVTADVLQSSNGGIWRLECPYYSHIYTRAVLQHIFSQLHNAWDTNKGERVLDPLSLGTQSSGMETGIAYTKQLENQTKENTLLNCTEQRTGSSQVEEHGLEVRDDGVEQRGSEMREEGAGLGRGTAVPSILKTRSHSIYPDSVFTTSLFIFPLCFYFSFFIWHYFLLFHSEFIISLYQFIFLIYIILSITFCHHFSTCFHYVVHFSIFFISCHLSFLCPSDSSPAFILPSFLLHV